MFYLQTLLNPDSGYIKDDTIKLEVLVMADAPHGVQFVFTFFGAFIYAFCYYNAVFCTWNGYIFSFSYSYSLEFEHSFKFMKKDCI